MNFATTAPANDASSPTRDTDPRMIGIRDICDRPYVRHGVTHERQPDVGHHVDVVPGVSIRLHGIDRNRYVRDVATGKMVPGEVHYDRTLRVGDMAEHNSHNLSYYGPILAIGAKTVTVEQTGHHGAKSRLSLYDFSRRNRHFNQAKADREAANWLD